MPGLLHGVPQRLVLTNQLGCPFPPGRVRQPAGHGRFVLGRPAQLGSQCLDPGLERLQLLLMTLQPGGMVVALHARFVQAGDLVGTGQNRGVEADGSQCLVEFGQCRLQARHLGLHQRTLPAGLLEDLPGIVRQQGRHARRLQRFLSLTDCFRVTQQGLHASDPFQSMDVLLDLGMLIAGFLQLVLDVHQCIMASLPVPRAQLGLAQGAPGVLIGVLLLVEDAVAGLAGSPE